MSTCESEAIAMAAGVAKVDFYRGFARELGFTVDKPWVIDVDNDYSGKRTRHMNLKWPSGRLSCATSLAVTMSRAS
jgi:hypothetical protein